MKTITIRDDVYEMLASIKENKSFSEVIRELIRRDVKRRGMEIMKLCISNGKPEKIFIEEVERGVKVEDVSRYFLPNRNEKGK